MASAFGIGIGICKEGMTNLSAEPMLEYYDIVSKVFDSEEEGFQFYNRYVLEKGFSVRKAYVEWDKGNEEICLMNLIRSRKGLPTSCPSSSSSIRIRRQQSSDQAFTEAPFLWAEQEQKSTAHHLPIFILVHSSYLTAFGPPLHYGKKVSASALPKGTQPEIKLYIERKHANMKVVCSSTKYATTIQGLSDEHKDAITHRTGLGGLLRMRKLSLQRLMLIRLAKRYISKSQGFHICSKVIPMTLTDVHHVMGLPTDGQEVRLKEKQGNNISLVDLKHNIATSTTLDDDFIRQFVLFTIGIILAPTANGYVDSKYLALVEDVAQISKFNRGQFTLSHLFHSIKNFLKEDQVSLQGNLILLQVWNWEKVRAYSYHSVSYTPIPPPYMARWDDRNAKRRIEAYARDGLDGGTVDDSFSPQYDLQNKSDMQSNIGHEENNAARVTSMFPEPSAMEAQREAGRLDGHKERAGPQKVTNMQAEKAEVISGVALQMILANQTDAFMNISTQLKEILKLLQTKTMKMTEPTHFQVIDAYAYLCDLETCSRSVLTTIQSQWLIQHAGAIPRGCGNQWVAAIATKCVGRNLYFIAGLHTTEYLQHALDVTSLECKKKEIQVLNSIPDPIFRDETKEALLVESIQHCIAIHFRVASYRLLITLSTLPDGKDDVIQIYIIKRTGTDCVLLWGIRAKVHACMGWGKMTENFSQEADYLANNSEKNTAEESNADDDIQEISMQVAAKKNNQSTKAKRKHGRPRKVKSALDSTKEKFSTKTIEKLVQSTIAKDRHGIKLSELLISGLVARKGCGLWHGLRDGLCCILSHAFNVAFPRLPLSRCGKLKLVAPGGAEDDAAQIAPPSLSGSSLLATSHQLSTATCSTSGAGQPARVFQGRGDAAVGGASRAQPDAQGRACRRPTVCCGAECALKGAALGERREHFRTDTCNRGRK
ncbi:hypothetical protein U9M48_002667 [Paspalum notatum var. saurae]|uniref:Aminotransferase-like plant mobile domain-containing protein n=1 Tax=Paspalum notatum var. saurae TaxID=547442 RepID=A0AAQ3PRT8_PASNO